MNADYMHEHFALDGQNAIVTGASSGIGRATAIALAQFGAREITLLGRNADKLKITENQVLATGAACRTCLVDVSKSAEVERFFSEYRRDHEKLDILVSNAGFNVRLDLVAISEEEFDALLAANFKGGWLCLREGCKCMQAQRSGSIVVVTSVNGLLPLPNAGIYSSTKAALESLMRSLAATMAPYGVRINSVAPGAVWTDLTKDVFSIKDVHDGKVADIPLGFIGQPPDIGNVIACVAGPAFRFMTGSTVVVDGGELLRKNMITAQK